MTTQDATSETVSQASNAKPTVPWHTQTKAFASRNLRTMLRTKATIIWGFGFPAFWYLLSSLLFLPDVSDVGGAATLADVKGAYAVSLGLFAVLTITLVAFAGGLTEDIRRKRYRKLRSLPVTPSADFAGRFVAGVLVAAVAYLLVLLVGGIDGAAYTVQGFASPVVVGGSFLLFALVGVSGAVVVTWFVNDTEIVVGITNAILLISFFLTGYNGTAPDVLPESTRALVNLVPNSLAARLQMGHLTGIPTQGQAAGGVTPPVLPVGVEYIALLAGWALVLGVVASVMMNRAIYQGEAGE